MSSLPDLAEYAAYETRTEITLEGVNFPGLVGQYFRREDGDRVETVGVYRFDGHEVFMAWGYADQAHCSFTAYRRKNGWTVP